MEDDDERWEKYMEHNRKLRKIHEEEIVKEKSDREIIAKKRMIKQASICGKSYSSIF